MRKVLLAIWPLIALSACFEDLDNVDNPVFKPAPVIEGIVTDLPGPYQVRMNMSTTIEDSLDTDPIDDALITISNGAGIKDTLILAASGLYETSSLQGELGQNYTLEVDWHGRNYFAQSEILPSLQVDSIQLNYREGGAYYEPGYYVSIFADKVSEEFTSYFRIHVWIDGQRLNSYEDLLVINDEFTSSLAGLEVPQHFLLGDEVRIEVHSIDRTMFDYYFGIIQLVQFSPNQIFSFPKNPITNLNNDALGYFQASSVERIDFVVSP